MLKRILFFIFLMYNCLSYTQNYSVADSQKINESVGNFIGDLDVNDNFGISIDAIGDLDGNGVNDLALGAYTDDDGGTNKGAVWILFMDSNNEVISHTKISDTSGNFTGILDAEDRFGGAVAYLGDLNNDGLIELAVGADYDGDGGFWHGAVWILSLNSDGTVNAHSKISDTQGGFTGFINGDAIFGTDIENIGDLNGDGIQDLAVGSRRDADGGSRRGAVWILFMNADFTVNSHQKISDTQGDFFALLEFEDYFGGSVASIGDLDQDGTNDIVVGAYRDDDQIANSGSFYVLFLNANGTVKNYQKVSNLEGGFNGTITNAALFGESIDGVVDIDNDGKIEIVVGALRQENPTQLNQTGAFYIIELNTDGTVSEEYLYTFGENCFTGTLNEGDFFGGSVTVLNDSGTYSFAVGAYKDSENGNDKGAVWILELGELSFSILTTQNPSGCDAGDGEIILGNLSANTTYEIAYEFESASITQTITSNANGELSITGLLEGEYTNIFVTNGTMSCSDNVGNVSLNSSSLEVTYTTQNPSMCGASDGNIVLENLDANTTYQISYEFNAVQETLNLTSDVNGEILVSNLSGGLYISFEVIDTNSNCEDSLGDIFIGEPTFVLTFTASNLSACGSSDGTILISDLTPNQNYVVDYFYESNLVQNQYEADVNGEILITNLSEGIYEFIMVVDTINSCTDGIGELEIEGVALMLNSMITSPSGCGINDGAITFQGAAANTDYTVSYVLNGTTETITVTSNASGDIEINNLQAGNYTSIIIEETATSCIINLGAILIEDPVFNLSLLTMNPSSCDINDGSIIFQGAIPNTIYTVSYELNSIPNMLSILADDQGNIVIENLDFGLYTNITIEQNNLECVAMFSVAELLCEDEAETERCFRIRNFFTPNNDSFNDTWYLEDVQGCDYLVYIYNRYGKLLTILTPNYPQWDGSYNGQALPSSDYWIAIHYTENNQKLVYNTNITLRR
ncbi:MAG: T9SS type B sorting domain-containing protein [Kordia sp.]|uniref:T9SS type B sorting domain-containing protein n=1 Tax=Kordia sp. TaxID=1965332 RepID=UPI00385C0961